MKDSGIFEGFTDWHSHILPGVDDGARTVEEALEILRLYEELGVKAVWLTPVSYTHLTLPTNREV